MRHRALLTISAAALIGVTSLVGTTTAGAAPSQTGQLHSTKVCGTPAAGHAACMSVVRTDAAGKPLATTTPSGFGPTTIQSAYKLTGLSSGGRTVAIVDAYNDPTAETDLATYRAAYGLAQCTTANGCFRKVNQSGGTSYPRTNGGWAQEISLDLDMVSATCPDCKILLVEAKSSSFANLGAAVKTAAATPGVVAISNSYGGGDASDGSYGTYYNHPGIAVTASTGDSGYRGGSYPASSSFVTAVCGTSLKKDARARGLAGVRLVISDAHEGSKAAIGAVLLGSAWQRCRVHFLRNVLARIPKGSAEMVLAAIRTVFAQPDAQAVSEQLDEIVTRLEPRFPVAAAMLAAAKTDVTAFSAFPVGHWRKIWSTNPLERVNKEVKRRTDVIGIFPNEAAVTRLAGAVLLEIHDEWAIAERRYLSEGSMARLDPAGDDGSTKEVERAKTVLLAS